MTSSSLDGTQAHTFSASLSEPYWSRPRFVYLVIAVYLLAHFLLRLTFGPVLGLDDAEQALFSQQFEWSYRYRAPPLFTWILIALTGPLPAGILTISLIRYGLLAVIFVFTYWNARLLLNDLRLAALATYGLATVYVYGFYSHHDLTHTTMMAAAVAVAWYVAFRLLHDPRWYWYAALGLVSAVGLLGKWNYVIFLAALLLTALSIKLARRDIVFTPKLLIAGLALLVVAGPTIVSTAYFGAEGKDTLQKVLGTRVGFSLADPFLSIAKLVGIIIAYPLPFLVVGMAAFWSQFRTGRANFNAINPRQTTTRLALTVRVMVIAIGLLALLVVTVGAEKVTERMLQPVLYPLPIVFLGLFDGQTGIERSLRMFLFMILTVVIVFFFARIATHFLEPHHCNSCRTFVPVPELAEGLKRNGFKQEGTVITEGHHLAGNLRVFLPGSRIVDTDYPLRFWSKTNPPDGNCALVKPIKPGRQLSAGTFEDLKIFLSRELGGKPESPAVEGILTLTLRGADDRKRAYAYRIYDNANGDCR